MGGWAYLLLNGCGEKHVASSALGPNSTSNIAEFTAILEVVTHSVILGVTQLLIHTDSFLALQYYEDTCSKDNIKLADLFKQIEAVALSGEAV